MAAVEQRENTNGLLRQYFPKGSNLHVHTAEELAAVAAELNERPRKTLGWDTPAQLLARHIGEPTRSRRSTARSSRNGHGRA